MFLGRGGGKGWDGAAFVCCLGGREGLVGAVGTQEDFESLFEEDYFLCKAQPPALIGAMFNKIKEPSDLAATVRFS